MVRLAEHAYNLPGHEQDAMKAIHSLVRGADAFFVMSDDPRVCVRAVMDVVAAAS